MIFANLIQTFVSVQPTLLGVIHNDFHARPGGFLFKGFLPWVTAEVGRLARRSEISEPVECMNYLQFNLETSASTVREYVYEWACVPQFISPSIQLTEGFREWMSFLASELPFEFVSTLHALGFSVIRPVWAAARQQITTQNVSPFGFPAFLVNSQFQTTILLYLLRDYLYYQIGWRAYGLFRQLLIRPGRPTRLSVKMAEEDDFVDDDSIIGIGRKLGTHTERRFYGSQTFRSALVIAFPWSSVLFQRKQNQEEIKKNVLSRCRLAAEIDDDTDARRPHLRTRAQNIVRNLESLGVDIEHDFYVDVDQWTRQIDHVQDPYIPITEGHSAAVHTHDSRRQSRPDSENPMFFDSEIRLDLPPPEPGLRRVVSIPQTASPLLTSPLLTPAQDEPSRAQDTEITPRPVRRPTETNMPDPDEEARIEWLVSSQRRSNARKKEKKKDRREYRMTRLTVFSAESFAWHASSLITSLILWPIDSLYFTSLSSWYTSMTGERSTAPMLARTHVRSSLIGLSMFRQSGMVLLCLGMESVVRGVLWQSASQIALYYGRRCDWGKF